MGFWSSFLSPLLMSISKLRFSISICAFFLLALFFVQEAHSQNMLEALTNPQARRPRLNQNANFEYGFPTQTEEGGKLRTRRGGIQLSLPLPFLSSPETAIRSSSQEEPLEERKKAQPKLQGGILFLPKYETLGLNDQNNLMPQELSTLEIGAFSFATVSERSGIRLGSYLNYRLKNDRIFSSFSKGQYIASAFAFVPASDEWFFTPGIGYVSDFAIGFLENVPIPSLEIIYSPISSQEEHNEKKPKRNLLLAFGVPFNFMRYSFTPWFQVRVLNFAGLLGEISLSQTLRDPEEPSSLHLSIREFFSRYAEVFNLQDNKFPEDSRLFIHGFQTGITLRASLPELFSLELTYSYRFQSRFTIGETRNDSVVHRLDLNPGHALGFALTYHF